MPGLRSFLVALGEQEPERALEVIAQASQSLGQKRPARLALATLQARALDAAARKRLYARTSELDLPFLPATQQLPDDSPLLAFQRAAKELRAAQVSQSQNHADKALARARTYLQDFQTSVAQTPHADALQRYLLPVARTWLDVVAEEQARLQERIREYRELPTPFVAGPSLGPDDQELFKGRRDLVRLIDHDLVGERRAPLVVLGQRRMGKSSLLQMLPIQLGTGTRVVTIDFQGLSGSGLRDAPHLWLEQEVARACPEAGAPPGKPAWSATLEWLQSSVEPALERADERVLIAIDEIERLQDGIESGWATADFLDFIRATGDRLGRVRMLLISAHPFRRLGPHWADRLISVIQRRVSYLPEDDARELICRPIPDFPDIYPEGGVDELLAQTHGHPYLIQLVCDELCRRLNEQRRPRATDRDIQAAIDLAFGKTNLFDELWQRLDQDERAWLRKLADGGPMGIEQQGAALRRLCKEDYVVEDSEHRLCIAVPMFATWIRDEHV